MYFFTHLFISKKLYKHFSGDFPLDKKSFAYGNIKPDISHHPIYRNPHTLENYLLFVNDRAKKLVEAEISLKDFSVDLGEICHYVCDFFCYYHLNEIIYRRLFDHFFYELRLHFIMYKIYYGNKRKLLSSRKEPRKNISSIILEMQKEYLLEPVSYKRDIDYALQTTIWTCESILFYIKTPYLLLNEQEQTPQTPRPLFQAKGGNV